jgi:DNA-binding IclR family transcriptional regulator
VVAALGVYVPAFRFTGEHGGEMIRRARETAAQISARLSPAQSGGER